MTKTSVKDPVCGMDIAASDTAAHSAHNGHTYYFCSVECQGKFDLAPEQYLKSSGKGSCGCC